MKKFILASLICFIGTSAMADQCGYVKKSQAEKAVRMLLEADTVQSLCEPCGQKRSTTIKVDSLGLQKIDNQLSEVVINGKGIDLAYIYMNGLNLAKLVGCNTQDVSPSIENK